MGERLPIRDLYCKGPPTDQTAVDLFAGEWSSTLPSDKTRAVTGGPAGLFQDGRIHWLLEKLGPVSGWKVTELGPLEGGHSFMLAQAGARVTAVEMHSRAYLRCLIAREILGHTGVRFLLGDGVEHLLCSQEEVDLVVASGVLYHQTDPLRLLEAAAARSRRLFLWTHVVDREAIRDRPEILRQFTGEWSQRRGSQSYTGLRRVYLEEHDWLGTCGGPEAGSVWMDRDSLLQALRDLGYTRIELAFDEPRHAHGPALAVLAVR